MLFTIQNQLIFKCQSEFLYQWPFNFPFNNFILWVNFPNERLLYAIRRNSNMILFKSSGNRDKEVLRNENVKRKWAKSHWKFYQFTELHTLVWKRIFITNPSMNMNETSAACMLPLAIHVIIFFITLSLRFSFLFFRFNFNFFFLPFLLTASLNATLSLSLTYAFAIF